MWKRNFLWCSVACTHVYRIFVIVMQGCNTFATLPLTERDNLPTSPSIDDFLSGVTCNAKDSKNMCSESITNLYQCLEANACLEPVNECQVGNLMRAFICRCLLSRVHLQDPYFGLEGCSCKGQNYVPGCYRQEVRPGWFSVSRWCSVEDAETCTASISLSGSDLTVSLQQCCPYCAHADNFTAHFR